ATNVRRERPELEASELSCSMQMFLIPPYKKGFMSTI
ncbi:MAG: hypothetical protein ACI9PP_001871, partial [Halobacteriales archaeon]